MNRETVKPGCVLLGISVLVYTVFRIMGMGFSHWELFFITLFLGTVGIIMILVGLFQRDKRL